MVLKIEKVQLRHKTIVFLMIMFMPLLEHQALMVHHTSPGFSWLGAQPTSGNSRSGDRPNLYISQSSSQHACQSNSQPFVKDSRVVD